MPIKTNHRTKQRLAWIAASKRGRRASLVLVVLGTLSASAYWLPLYFDRGHDAEQSATASSVDSRTFSDSQRSPGKATPAEGLKRAPVARTVYAYAVIPGGAHSVAELRSAIAGDPVVSAAYSHFRLENAHVIRLEADRSVHVSYRLGDRVFWTTRELKLEKGEALITDGVETARTKCGNFISESASAPASPEEPTELTLNTPIDVRYDPPGPESDDRFPELAPPPPAGAPSYLQPGSESPPYTGGPGPIFFFPEPTRRKPSSSPPPTNPSLPPVVNTPEPGTAFQLLLSFPAILLLLWWRARSKRSLEGMRGTR